MLPVQDATLETALFLQDQPIPILHLVPDPHIAAAESDEGVAVLQAGAALSTMTTETDTATLVIAQQRNVRIAHGAVHLQDAGREMYERKEILKGGTVMTVDSFHENTIHT